MATIVVTGASSGFGRATADRLAGAGHRVYAASRSFATRQPADVPREDGVVIETHLDVRSGASRLALLELVGAVDGGLDVLVNNAGVMVVGPLEDLSDQEMADVLETNLLGAIQLTRLTLPSIRARRGRIVNVSSISGVSAAPLYGMYAVSKYGLEAFTEALALEVLPLGVTVTLVRPGYFATGMRSHSRRADGFVEGSPYFDSFAAATAKHRSDADNAPDPAPVVDALVHAAVGDDPRPLAVVGRDVELVSRLRANPDRLRETIVTLYGVRTPDAVPAGAAST